MKDQGSIKPPLSLLCSTFTLTCASELKLEQNLTEPSICPSFPKLESQKLFTLCVHLKTPSETKIQNFGTFR